MPILIFIVTVIAFFIPKMEQTLCSGHTASPISVEHHCCSHESVELCAIPESKETHESKEKKPPCCDGDGSCECSCCCHSKLPVHAQLLTSLSWIGLSAEADHYFLSKKLSSIRSHPPSPPPQIT